MTRAALQLHSRGRSEGSKRCAPLTRREEDLRAGLTSLAKGERTPLPCLARRRLSAPVRIGHQSNGGSSRAMRQVLIRKHWCQRVAAQSRNDVEVMKSSSTDFVLREPDVSFRGTRNLGALPRTDAVARDSSLPLGMTRFPPGAVELPGSRFSSERPSSEGFEVWRAPRLIRALARSSRVARHAPCNAKAHARIASHLAHSRRRQCRAVHEDGREAADLNTKTPTAACAAVGASSCCSRGDRRIASPVPGIRAYRQLLSGVPMSVSTPVFVCRRRWLGVRDIAAADHTVSVLRRCRRTSAGPGSHRSTVASSPISAWRPGLLRLPPRLRGSWCLSTYTLNDCSRLSRGSAGQFLRRRKIALVAAARVPHRGVILEVVGTFAGGV
jgi:hypothetical protein